MDATTNISKEEFLEKIEKAKKTLDRYRKVDKQYLISEAFLNRLFEIAYTAIPVEWMKTWLEKNREPYDPFGILSWGIETMIKDWEKENVEQRRI